MQNDIFPAEAIPFTFYIQYSIFYISHRNFSFNPRMRLIIFKHKIFVAESENVFDSRIYFHNR